MSTILDIFDEFSNRCPICLMGNPVEIDDTDNPDRAYISMHNIFAYQCDTCGWKTAGHIQQGDYKKILDERWNEKSKTRIASIRYNLGVSIIANKLSAWEFYLEQQMVA